MRRSRPDRRNAATQYSRTVRGMKTALPILAILSVAAVFLIGREDPGAIFSSEELAGLEAGIRIENPRFSGTTDAGDPFTLRAVSAVPNDPARNRIELERPGGTLTLPDGRTVNGRSERGLMLRDLEDLILTRDVVIATSDGYRIETEEIVIDLALKEAEGSGKIRGFGPEGTLEAGRFRMERKKNGRRRQAPGLVLFFEDAVRVVFIPEKAR